MTRRGCRIGAEPDAHRDPCPRPGAATALLRVGAPRATRSAVAVVQVRLGHQTVAGRRGDSEASQAGSDSETARPGRRASLAARFELAGLGQDSADPSSSSQIASLAVQCRQAYCLVEMGPSAPSRRPPHQRVSWTASLAGEEDQTNVATHQSFPSLSTYPTLKRSRRRRTAPAAHMEPDPEINLS